MKKLLVISALFMLGALSVSAQTYCYKFLYCVTKDGVKKLLPGQVSGALHYMTFTNNKQMCYNTDKDGIYRMGYGQFSYRYIGKRNGMLVYKEQSTNMFWSNTTLFFSPDFSRYNQKGQGYDASNSLTYVYEYVEDPYEEDTPEELY